MLCRLESIHEEELSSIDYVLRDANLGSQTLPEGEKP